MSVNTPPLVPRLRSRRPKRSRRARGRFESLERRLVLAGSQIAFVDPSLWDGLSAELSAAVDEVVQLDGERDGIDQIAAYLAGRDSIAAVHLISHGHVGALSLGGTRELNAANISTYATQLATIGSALSVEGDILLWGCDVAGGEGKSFVDQLAEATGADVAASTDLSGPRNLGGDWNLEYATGVIEAPAILSTIDPQLVLSHFRGGSVTHTVSAAGVVELEVFSLWRQHAFETPFFVLNEGPSLGGANIGNFLLQSHDDQFGSGAELGGAIFNVARSTFSFDLAAAGLAPGTYYAIWQNGARVAGIRNPGGASVYWELETAIVWDGVNASASPTLLPATIDIVAQGHPYTQYLNSTDPDGTPVNYEFVVGLDDPHYGPANSITGINLDSLGGVNISAANTASLAQGRWVYKVRVTDGQGAYSERDVMVVVEDPLNPDDPNPHAPLLTPLGPQRVPVGTPLSLEIIGDDPNGEDVTVRSQLLPPGASMVEATARGSASSNFSWTPQPGQEGKYFVNFETFESGESVPIIDNELVEIEVVGVNRPPVLEAIGNQTVANGGTVTLVVNGSDADGDNLTFDAFFVPPGANFDPVTRVFSWTPPPSQYNNTFVGLTFQVIDDGVPSLSDQETIAITIGSGNQAPQFTPLSNITVPIDEEVVVNVVVNDTGAGQTITLTDVLRPIGSNFVSAAGNPPVSGVFSWTPTAADIGMHTVRLRAEDNGNPILNSIEEFTITVVEPAANFPPALGPLILSDSVIDENGAVTVSGVFLDSDLADTHAITITWGANETATTMTTTGPNPPGTELVNQGGGSWTFSASHTYLDDNPSATSTDDHTIDVRVTDQELGADSAQATLSVTNVAPAMAPLVLDTDIVEEGGTVTISGLFFDAGPSDVHTVIIDWGGGAPGQPAEGTTTITTVGPNPIGATLTDVGGGSWSFAASHEYVDDNSSGTQSDEYTIAVTVTDDDLGTDSDSATVTVVNVAPAIEGVVVTPTVNEQQVATLSGTIVDPGVMDSFTMGVHWGDGTSNSFTLGTAALDRADVAGDLLTWEPSSGAFSVEHQYRDDDPSGTPTDVLQVILTGVSDDDGGTAGVAAPTVAGNLFLTGHSILLHEHQAGYDTVILDFLRGAGTSDEIPRADYDIGYLREIDRGEPGEGAFGAVSEDSPLNLATGGGITSFLSGIDVLYVSSVFDIGGGLGVSALNAFKNNIAAFINDGGDVVVESSGALPTFYNFLPANAAVTGATIEGDTGFTATPPGQIIGITEAMINGHTAQNQFTSFDPSYTVFEVRGENVVSIGRGPGLESALSGFEVTVNNVAPSLGAVSLSSSTVVEGDSVTVSGTFSDPGLLDTHTVRIDWGGAPGQADEGDTVLTTAGPNPPSATLTDLGDGNWSFTATHQYQDDNPPATAVDEYSISVSVTDDDLGTDALVETIAIRNAAPTIGDLSLSSQVVPADGNVVVTGTFADPGADTHTIVIGWGGGTGGIPSEGTTIIPSAGPHPAGTTLTDLGNGTWTFTAVHQYLTSTPVPNSYTIAVDITDDDGGADSRSATIAVSDTGPRLNPLVVDSSTVMEGQSVTLSGIFAVGSAGTHTVVVDWGGGTGPQPAEGTVTLTTAGPNPAGTSLADLGDGTWSFSATHEYLDDNSTGTSADEYSIDVTVRDADGDSDAASTTVTVENASARLDPLFLDAATIDEGGLLTLTGQFTDDGQLDTHTVVIDWGGGSADQPSEGTTTLTTAGPNPPGTTLIDRGGGTWRFSATRHYLDDNPTGTPADDYTINVSVTDDDGGSDSEVTLVTVDNAAPQLGPLVLDTATVDEGGLVTLTGQFSDPGLLDTHTVVIDWGGGAADQPTEGTTTLTTAGPNPADTTFTALGDGTWSFSATHRYVDDNPTGTPADDYTINVSVTDDDSGSDSDSTLVTVDNAAPQLDPLVLDAAAVDEGGLVTLTGQFSDPGLLDTHTVVIDWGGGAADQPAEGTTTLTTAGPNPLDTTFTDLGDGTWSFSATHRYADDNPTGTPADDYTISVSVTDDDSGSDSDSTLVTVDNAAPQLGPLVLDAATVDEGGLVTLTGQFVDAGLLDTHTVVIDWGGGAADQPAEGTTTLTTAEPNPVDTTFTDLGDGIWSFSATHRYVDDNPTGTPADDYTINVSVTDDDSGSDSESATISTQNVVPVLEPLVLSTTSLSDDGKVTVTGTFNDAGLADTHTVVIDWGGGVDGQPAEGSTTLTTLGPNPDETSYADQGGGSWLFTATHTYPIAATSATSFTITARVTDDDGGVDLTTATVAVSNTAPQLGPLILDMTTIDEGGLVTLTGQFTDSGLLDTHTVVIDWGGGSANQPAEGTTTLTTAGPNPADTTFTALGDGTWSFSATHRYADDNPTGTPADDYTINVTVTDDDGGSDSDSTLVSVDNAAPQLGPLVLDAATVDEGGLVTLTGQFVDSGLLDTHTVVIDWGGGAADQPAEGTTTLTTAGPNPVDTTFTDLGDGTWSFSATHRYADDNPTGTPADDYTINVSVADDDGGSDSDSTLVSVDNAAPQLGPLVLDAATIDEGGLVTLTGQFSDAGLLDTHTVVIDWGGGSADQPAEGTTTLTTAGPNPLDATFTDLGDGTWSFSATHRYADDNPTGTPADDYTINVSVTDDDSGSNSDSTLVTVDNAAPQLGPLVLDAGTIDEGGSVTLTGQFTDPGLLDTHTVVIDWGGGAADQPAEGTTTLTTAGPNPTDTTFTDLGDGTWSFSATHRYADDNPTGTPADDYTISVSVTDDDGGSDSDSTLVSADNAAPQLGPLVLDAATIDESGLVTLTGQFVDAGLLDTHTVVIDWGGGSADQPAEGTTTLTTAGPNPLDTTFTDLGDGVWSFSATHRYADDNPTGTPADDYTINVSVTDDDSGSDSESATISTQNVVPVLDPLVLSTTSLSDDGKVTVTGTFNDAGLADTHTVVIDWGGGVDGQPAEGSTTLTTLGPNPDETSYADQGGGSWLFTATHTYPIAATSATSFTITARVTDDDGGVDLTTATVAVSNTAPQLGPLILDMTTVDEGGLVTLTGQFTDSGLLDTHTVVIDWGGGSADQPAEGTTTLTTAGPNPADTTFTNLGDGTWSFSATHRYADDNPTGTPADDYTINVSVTDDDGGSDSEATLVAVDNAAPQLGPLVLDAATVDEGGLVTLTGQFVDAGLLDTHTVVIDWGGGAADQPAEGTTTLTTAGPNPVDTTFTDLGDGTWSFSATHRYADDNPTGTPADDYTINVSVTDDDSGSDSDSTLVTVDNAAPQLDPLVLDAATIDEGGLVTLTGQFSDPGLLDTHTVVIDWGGGAADQPAEGTTTLTTAGPNPVDTTFTDLGDGTWSFSATHRYVDDNPTGTPADNYTINVSVTDDDSGSDSDSTLVSVDNAAPQLGPLVLDAATIDEGGLVTLTGQFSDAGLLDAHTVVIDWGGGAADQPAEGVTTLTTAGPNPVDTTFTDLGDGTWSFSATHRYADDNPTGTPADDYTINVSVTDDDSGSDSDSALVSVDNAAPQLGPLVLDAATIDEGGLVTLTGQFSDPGPLDTHMVVIDWGGGAADQLAEGITTLTTAGPNPVDTTFTDLGDGTWSFSATHRYADDNPTGTPADDYTINVSVTDDDSGSDSDSTLVSVDNAAPQLGPLVLDAATIDEGGLVTLTGQFSDPGPLDTHTVVIDWGGGAADQPAEGTTTLTTAGPNPVDTTFTDLGDGTWSFSATHRYVDDNPTGTPADDYTISVSVTDDDGSGDSNTRSLAVTNTAPSLGSLEPSTIAIPADGELSVVGTFNDPGLQDALTLTVDWGGGSGGQPVEGVTTITTEGPNPPGSQLVNLGNGSWQFTLTHVYAVAGGSYTITATVTDDDLGTASVATIVGVENAPPVLADLVLNVDSVDEAGEVTLTGSFVDSGVLDSHTILVDWGGDLPGQPGEGTTTITTLGPNPVGATLTNLGSGEWRFSATHTYLDDDPTTTSVDQYTILVTVTDNLLATDSMATSVAVTNVAPAMGALQVNAATIGEGDPVTVSGTFFDPGLRDTHSILIDWGGGQAGRPDEGTTTLSTQGPQPANATLNDLGDGSWMFTATHVYPDDHPTATSVDDYTITATVTDDDSATSSATATASVHNLAPLIGPLTLSSAAIQEDGSVTLSGTFTDPGVQDSHTVLIDWGGGAAGQWDEGSITITTGSSDGQGSFTATHRYLDDNPTLTGSDTYTITVTVMDDDGGVASNTVTLSVDNDAPQLAALQLNSAEIEENGLVTVSGVFTDPGMLDRHRVVVDWDSEDGNEGTTTITTIGPNEPETVLENLGGGSWNFIATHRYTDDNPTGTSADSYTIKVTVTDDDGGSDSESASVSVRNVMPVLEPLVLSTTSLSGDGKVTVTGTFSDASSADTHTVLIDWGGGVDGQPAEGTTTLTTLGPNPVDTSYTDQGGGNWLFTATHTYPLESTSATSFTITAEVTDDDGGADTAMAVVTVSNTAPQFAGLQLSSPSLVEGGLLTLSGSFSDPGLLDTHTVTIDWGGGGANQPSEGTTTLTTAGPNPVDTTFTDLGGGTWRFSATHRYTDDNPTGTAADNYTITATVMDDDGRSDTESATIMVDNAAVQLHPPVLDSATVDEGGLVMLSGRFTDAGLDDTHTVVIDWGDTAGDQPPATTTLTTNGPNPVDTTLTDLGDGEWGFSAIHRYLEQPAIGAPDKYTIRLSVMDDDGGSSTGEQEVEVRNAPPVLSSLAFPSASIDEGDVATLTGTFVDAGLLDSHQIVIDWGGDERPSEGTTVITTQGPNPPGVTLTQLSSGGWTFTASHQYLDDRPTATVTDEYSVTVTVTDDDGGSTAGSVPLTVRNTPPVVDSLELSSVTLTEDGSVTLTGTFSDAGTQDSHIVEIDWGGGAAGQPPEGTTVIATSAGGGNFSFTATHRYFDDNPTGTATDEYLVNVIVTDDDGGRVSDLRTIAVANEPPTIGGLTLETTLVDGTTVAVLGGTFFDPGLFDTHAVAIDWGDDGATTTITTPGPNPPETSLVSLGDGSWDFTATHSYQGRSPTGNYAVTATVRDDDLGTTTATTSVTVENTAPVLEPILLDVMEINEGGEVTLTGTFFDADLSDTHSVSIDWGDAIPGSPPNNTVLTTSGPLPPGASLTNVGNGQWRYAATHRYLDDMPTATPSDDYTVTVTVTDELSGTDSATTTVTVDNVTPGLDSLIVSSSQIDENGRVTVTVTFSDPGLDDQHSVTIDWGGGVIAGQAPEGTTTVTTAGPNPFGSTAQYLGDAVWQVTAMHQYLNDGPAQTASDEYRISVTVGDDDGGSSSRETPLRVNNVAPLIDPLVLDTATVDEDGIVIVTGTFSDPGLFDEHTLVIDWGGGELPQQPHEGTTTLTTADAHSLPSKEGGRARPRAKFRRLTNLGGGRWSFVASHQYLDDNPTTTREDAYTIIATVVDSDLGTTSAAAEVTVRNVAPQVQPLTLDATPLVEGGTVTVSGSFYDPRLEDTHTVVIDWGGALIGGQSEEGTQQITATGPNPVGASLVGSGDGFWNFTASHRYLDDRPTASNSDVYTITATVTDDDGGVQTISTPLVVQNADPVVQPLALGASSLAEDNSVTVTGTFSDLGSMDTHTIVINWGGVEGTTTLTAVGPNPPGATLLKQSDDSWVFSASHHYVDDSFAATSQDTYTITATVMDDDSGVGVMATPIEVRNIPPVIEPLILSDTSVFESQSVTITGRFRDPGLLDTHTILIDWGDAESGVTTIETNVPNPATSLINLGEGNWQFGATHKYLDDNPGSTGSDENEIVVTIIDNAAGVGTSAASIQVNDIPPLVDPLVLSAEAINEGGAVLLSGSFSDPGLEDSHTIVIDWARNARFRQRRLTEGLTTITSTGPNPAGTTLTNLGGGNWSFTAAHQYLDDNPAGDPSDTYVIQVTVTDDDTLYTTGTGAVLVQNVAPEIDRASLSVTTEDNAPPAVGVKVFFSLRFTDIGILDAHDVVIEWGDGDVSDTSVSLSDVDFPEFNQSDGGVGSFVAQHTYSEHGTYEVNVSILDDDAGSGTMTTEIVVAPTNPAALSNALRNLGESLHLRRRDQASPSVSNDALNQPEALSSPSNTLDHSLPPALRPEPGPTSSTTRSHPSDELGVVRYLPNDLLEMLAEDLLSRPARNDEPQGPGDS